VAPKRSVSIFDKGGAKPYTTVKQDFGIVSVEAEVRDVQHFAVVTPFLAAVVKGTRFVVASGQSTAWVKVRRGHVEVEDSHEHTHVMLAVGQSAAMDMRKGQGMTVAGSGTIAAIVDAQGDAVVSDDGSAESSGKGMSATALSSGNGESGDGTGDRSEKKSGNGKSKSGKGDSGKGDSGKGDRGKGDSGKGDSGKGDSGKGDSGKGDSGKGDSGDVAKTTDRTAAKPVGSEPLPIGLGLCALNWAALGILPPHHRVIPAKAGIPVCLT